MGPEVAGNGPGIPPEGRGTTADGGWTGIGWGGNGASWAFPLPGSASAPPTSKIIREFRTSFRIKSLPFCCIHDDGTPVGTIPEAEPGARPGKRPGKRG